MTLKANKLDRYINSAVAGSRHRTFVKFTRVFHLGHRILNNNLGHNYKVPMAVKCCQLVYYEAF